jgi:PAS domain S-box-containing protein
MLMIPHWRIFQEHPEQRLMDTPESSMASSASLDSASFRQLFEDAPIAMARSLPDGRFADINTKYAEAFGYPSISEFLAGNLRTVDLYHEVSAGEDLFGRASREPGPYTAEPVLKRRDGTVFVGHVTIRVVRDSRGNASYFESFLEDVTEQRRTESLLKEGEERFRALSEAAQEAITLHENGIIVDCNGAAEELTGYSRDELIGKSILELAAPESKTMYRENMALGVQNSYEGLLRRKDGSLRIVEQRSRNIMYRGRPVRVTASRDLTEQKKAERSLRIVEDRYRALVDTSPDAIGFFDAQANLVLINPAGVSLFGYSSSAEMEGRNALGFFVPEEQMEAMQTIQGVFTRGIVRNAKFKLVRRDGSTFDSEFSCSAVFDSAGKPASIIAVTRDITDRVETEQRVLKGLREKEVLLKEVHHRVKNNLNVVASLLSLQSKYVKSPDDAALFMESRDRIVAMSKIHETLYRSNDLANIDFAAYVSGLSQGLVSAFRRPNVAMNIRIQNCSIELSKAIPLGIIINELITNCFKYAFPGNMAGVITIEMSAPAGGSILLRITDNGVGLPGGVSLQNPSSLGLSLVALLTEQVQGTVRILPAPGTGFEFEVPS